jgi:hypothetical protein
MKHPLILAKSACILLISALLTVLTILANEVLFNYGNVNWIVFVVVLWTLTSLSSYFITVRYCNKIMGEDGVKSPGSKATIFLVVTIIGLGFSTFVLILLLAEILNGGFSVVSRMIVDNPKIKEIVIFFSSILIAIFGPITFFLQLYVRKAFLLKAKTSSDKLVDSIGVDENNSAV